MKRIICLIICVFSLFFIVGCKNDSYPLLKVNDDEQISFNNEIYIPYSYNSPTTRFCLHETSTKTKVGEIWNFYHLSKLNVMVDDEDIEQNFLYIQWLANELWVKKTFVLPEILDSDIESIILKNNDHYKISEENPIKLKEIINLNIYFDDITNYSNNLTFYLKDYSYLEIDGINLIREYHGENNIYYLGINDDKFNAIFYQVYSEYNYLFDNIFN